VRYIGIDTPEIHPRLEHYGAEAAARNRDLVEGRVVRLESDQTDRDRYGRLLRYVYVDGLLVNAELVRLGYARAVAYPPDTRYQHVLARAEEEAKGAGRGLWGQATCLPGPARALCSGGSGRSASTCQADASLPERQYGLHAGLHRSYA